MRARLGHARRRRSTRLRRSGGAARARCGFDALCESLESVRRSGTGRVVLVGGEAGSGRPRSYDGSAGNAGGRPRSSGVAAIRCSLRGRSGPLLSVAEEAGGPLEEVVTSGAMPHELAAALVRQLSAHPGTVFVLEDVHWADEATLDVLKLLARRVAAVPVLVVASFRDDELDPSHPLRRVLGELATSATVRRLKLDRLSPCGGGPTCRTTGCRSERALPQDRRQPLLRCRGAGRRRPTRYPKRSGMPCSHALRA
jgi:hypothetical protein